MTTEHADRPGDAVTRIPPGHQVRRRTAWALWCTVLTGVAFSAWAYLTTQDHGIVPSTPWQDDPYHGVVSFTEFLVPAMTVVLLVRATLWRRRCPQPAFRLNQLVRAGMVCATLVALTVLTDALAVALRADHDRWDTTTPWLVASLAPLTLFAAASLVLQRIALRRLPRAVDGDWLDDLAELVHLVARWRPTRPVELVREHVVVSAVLLSLLAGAGVTTLQAVGEGGETIEFFAISVLVVTGGFLAFCLICNGVLHIAVPRTGAVRRRVGGRARRAFRSGVIAWALALPAAAVLRDQIWLLLGHREQVDSVGTYTGITLIGSLLVGLLVFGGVLALSRRDTRPHSTAVP